MLTDDPELTETALEMPGIYCPIRFRVHPDAETIDNYLLRWVTSHQLITSKEELDRYAGSRFGRFAAYTYPRIPDLRVVALWHGHNWVVDDALDELGTSVDSAASLAAELLAQMPVDLTPTQTARRPVTAAAADLWQRTAPPRSRAWRERYVAHYRDWLAFTLRARQYRPHMLDAPANVAGYIRRRRLNSGAEMTFDLLEVGYDRELPEAVVNSDPYRMLRYAANDAIGWTNDIFSVRKELAQQDPDHLVAVLRHAHGGGWDKQMANAAEMIRHATDDFLVACDDLRASRALYAVTDEEWASVEHSLHDLELWIAGSLHWHAETQRYLGARVRA